MTLLNDAFNKQGSGDGEPDVSTGLGNRFYF